MSYTGWWNDGQSARRLAVRIRVAAQQLMVYDENDQSVAIWPLADLRLAEEAYASQPLRFKHPAAAEAILTVDNHGILERLAPQAPAIRRRYHGRRGTLARFAIWIGALVALSGLLIFSIPRAAKPIAALIPHEWEESLGKAVSASLLKDTDICTGEAGQAVLDRLTGRLLLGAPTDYEFRVRVVDRKEVNAFALPAGQIVINSGLIDFAETPEEFTAVLAHEMAHVIEQHSMQNLIRQLGFSALLAGLAGDASTLGSVVGQTGKVLVDRAYSRGDEADADALGVELLSKANIRSDGLAAFFERLSESKGDLATLMPLLSSHPSNKQRIAMAEQTGRPGGVAMSVAEWTALLGICSSGSVKAHS